MLEIWVEHGANEKLKMEIGEILKKILNMDANNLTFYFKKHDSSLKVILLKFRIYLCSKELKNILLKVHLLKHLMQPL